MNMLTSLALVVALVVAVAALAVATLAHYRLVTYLEQLQTELQDRGYLKPRPDPRPADRERRTA